MTGRCESSDDGAWRDLDETVADGPGPAQVPAAAKPWLAQQRFVHGLLRALHTPDAAAREGRIECLLRRIDAEREAAIGRRRHRLLVAIAAAALVASILWLSLPARLPTAEAAVLQMVEVLERDVDRRFKVEVQVVAADGSEKVRHELLLVTRPGMRFLVDGRLSFGGLALAGIRVGCDGAELWLQPANGAFHHAVPLAERERLIDKLGHVLDLGYVDVHDLVRRLPDDLELRVVGRERGADDRELLRVAGTSHDGLLSAWLLYEEGTGMVRHIEVERAIAFGRRRIIVLDYLGEEPPGLVDYARPW
ncbi:MAG: hypothetical protein KDC98_24760, partial [Planctomycetes bacterium]|nr:hypothetical protein [Planctomycetota bacterium]